MKKKSTKKKAKKIVVNLSERDFVKIGEYAKIHRTSRSIAAKRMLHMQLAALQSTKSDNAPKNQLGLFDSVQLNIFDKS
ncbi:MAG: hypothetical protein J5848_04030 [Bacteroidales bacterium]|nr:hypothetical protein [Bacteroidales bacterium]